MGSPRPSRRSSPDSTWATPTSAGRPSCPVPSRSSLSGHSSKTRRNLRSYARKLEHAYDGRLEIRRFTRPDQIDDFFHDVEVSSRRRRTRAPSASLSATRPYTGRERSCARAWVSAATCSRSMDNPPRSSSASSTADVSASAGRAMTPPSASPHRHVPAPQVLEELCSDDEVRLVDFGIGDAEFKERFGTKMDRRERADLYVHAAGSSDQLTRTALESVIRAARASPVAASWLPRSRDARDGALAPVRLVAPGAFLSAWVASKRASRLGCELRARSGRRAAAHTCARCGRGEQKTHVSHQSCASRLR